MQEVNQPHWQLSTRVNYLRQAIFKIKEMNDDEFITHLPTKRVVQTFDNQLQNMGKNYTFSQEIQAIQYFSLNGSTFVAAGTKQGLLELKNIEQNQTYQLSCSQAIQTAHKYVNDMLYLGDGRLINCYNNGKIAIWNLHSLLSNNLEPVALKQIHSSFTYKIRRVDPETVLTCSNDGCVKLIDIDQCEIIDSFQHEDGVWCAYPINQNVFCSGGLMNKLVFWDSRQKKIINKCQLSNEEVSYITRFDENRLIFGDQKELSTCDLRKTVKSAFGNAIMKVSAESILVRKDEVIVTGRGGDLCRFVNSDQPVILEERSIGQPLNALGMNFPQNIMQLLQNFNNVHPDLFLVQPFGDLDEDLALFDDNDLLEIEDDMDNNEDEHLNEAEGEYANMMDEDDDWEDIADNEEQQSAVQPEMGPMDVENSEEDEQEHPQSSEPSQSKEPHIEGSHEQDSS